MTLEPLKDAETKSREFPTKFQQLEIPGMEEFLPKLNAKSKNPRKSQPK